jgi:DNA polymerase-3 subunit delta'
MDMNSHRHLPWQTSQWKSLMNLRARLPHALLFHGPAGIGKTQFVSAFCQSLLCESPDSEGHACGICQNCSLYAAGTHPDFLRVTIQDDATRIKIDQIRELIEFSFLSRSFAAVKIIVILGADTMNTEAANSLLKTLEEPPAGTVIILSCQRPSALPATVKSRCQKLRFTVPEHALALDWLSAQGLDGDPASRLDAAGGAPMAAASPELDFRLGERIADALSRWSEARLPAIDCASQLEAIGVGAVLSRIAPWINTALVERLRSGTDTQQVRPFFRGIGADGLLSLYDEVLRHCGRLSTTLNPHLILEDLLCFWTQLRNRRSSRMLN